MASIVITTQPVSQVVAGGANPQDISVVATYDGAQTLLYQWYECNAEGEEQVEIDGATTDELTFGTMQPGTTRYYICELSAADVATPVLTDVAYLQQNGIVPVINVDYITGAYVHDYIAQTSLEVQARFVSEQARTGIEIPDTAVPLMSAQLDLFYSII